MVDLPTNLSSAHRLTLNHSTVKPSRSQLSTAH